MEAEINELILLFYSQQNSFLWTPNVDPKCELKVKSDIISMGYNVQLNNCSSTSYIHDMDNKVGIGKFIS